MSPSHRRATAGTLQGLLVYHQGLLADTRRNRAFHRALTARVRPGQTVLDIGAGSGVWGVLAARLGARRVVAVEREGALQPIIQRLAEENGVADRVEVVCTSARRLDLPREFDVVVSETVGSEGFEEGIVPIMARARERFLKPRGALIPEALALRGAPLGPIDAGGLSPPLLSDESFTSLSRQVPRSVPAGPFTTLAPSRELLRVDLRSVSEDDPLPPGGARFRVSDGRAVGGIAVWVDVTLCQGVRLQTRWSPSWVSLYLPLDPLPRGPGRLSLDLDWSPDSRRWSVLFEGDDGARRGSQHSPLFAWGAVRPALREAPARRSARPRR